MDITFYQTALGNRPVEKFFTTLDKASAQVIAGVLSDIEKDGLEGPTVGKRQIHKDLWELKIWKHRLFYTLVSGPQMVLLHACKKQGKKARRVDITTAKRRLAKLGS